MNNEVVIEVKNVSKKFKVFIDKGHTIKEKVLFNKRRKYETRTVLDNISFSVKKGEAIGLIGKNGCGKSTTLKLLTKIIYPDSGSIKMKGRVSSLIELGAGFHPDMSGRENIYINASIFGLTRKEIDERLYQIIKFSELEKFIDNPVRTYSSGMYMRLAFSVAINVEADILLIDEILAVGDANFQSKCFNKLKEIKERGTTIIIVSHSMEQIEQICDRSIWIQNGKIKADGVPREIHSHYMDYMGHQNFERLNYANLESKIKKRQNGDEIEYWDGKQKVRWGNQKACITKTYLLNSREEKVNVIKSGERIRLHVEYEVYNKVEDAVFGIGIFRVDGLQCYGTNTRIERFEKFDLEKNGEFSLLLDSFDLLPGEYTIDITIEMGMGVPVDYYTKAIKCVVYSEITDVGVVRLKHNWKAKLLKGD